MINSLTRGMPYGGRPFVLLLDPSTFGSPAGGKEIEVLVKSLKKMKEKDTNLNFLSSGRCLPEVQTMFCRIGPKNLKF